jgi:hypothetical protein
MNDERLESIRNEIENILDDENIEPLKGIEPENAEEDYIVNEILKNLLSKELLEEPLRSLKNEIKNSKKENDKEAYKIISEIEELLSKEAKETDKLVQLLDRVSS